VSLGCFSKSLSKRAIGLVYPPNDTILNLVKGFCIRKCIEVKDKALAMHAILQRLLIFELRLPNLTLLICEIYSELLRNIIEVIRLLALLIPVATNYFKDSPLWAPDWFTAIDLL
jgi:hypothetical protein